METTACPQETNAADVRKNQRRKYIINPSFQWRFVLSIAATVFLTSSIISSVLYGVLHEQARERFMEPSTYVAEVSLVLIGFGLLFSCIAAAGVGCWCMLMTHRICGPLHVVGCQLRELAAGRLPKPRNLRTRDEFKDFYQLFCQAMESVRTRQQQAIKVLGELIGIGQRALDAGNEPDKQALSDMVRRLRDLQDSISRTGCMN